MQPTSHFSILKEKIFIESFILSSLFLICTLIINYFSSVYVDKVISNSVTDIFLSNIPVFDVDFIFIYGPLLFWIFIFIISLNHIKKLPFILYSIGLFTLIRAIFVSLTHIGPFPTQAIIGSTNIIARFSASNDLFFSGHTGLPFLMALIFWNIKSIRIICILSSVFFGIIVLLGHYHYSIDVLSAYFITYSIYKISEKLFKKEMSFFKI